MPYVSARYGPPPLEGEQQMIVATDENGVEWWLAEDSQVGDWLRFVEQGGMVMAASGEPETAVE